MPSSSNPPDLKYTESHEWLRLESDGSYTIGITGHAQVHLQYDTSVEDVRKKVEHDLEYIATRSVWQDMMIMIKTIPVMLFRKGGW